MRIIELQIAKAPLSEFKDISKAAEEKWRGIIPKISWRYNVIMRTVVLNAKKISSLFCNLFRSLVIPGALTFIITIFLVRDITSSGRPIKIIKRVFYIVVMPYSRIA